MALLELDRSSAALAHRIRRQLSGSGWGTSHLQIEDDGHAVTLRGIANSFYQRQLWLHRTKQVIGDRRLNDQIAVTESQDAQAFAAFE